MAYQTDHETVVRDWGYFQVLACIPQLKFKKLVLMPGKATSLQYHHHRSEFWTVLSGVGEAFIDGTMHQLFADKTLWVDPGVVHQLQNTGSDSLVIHEVQQGDYLEEDDIVRLSGLGADAQLPPNACKTRT